MIWTGANLPQIWYVLLGSNEFVLYDSSKSSHLHRDHTFNLSKHLLIDFKRSITVCCPIIATIKGYCLGQQVSGESVRLLATAELPVVQLPLPPYQTDHCTRQRQARNSPGQVFRKCPHIGSTITINSLLLTSVPQALQQVSEAYFGRPHALQ